MKRLFVLVGIALILGAVSSFAAEQTWSGQISDSMCNADHQAMAQDGKKVDARECPLACTKKCLAQHDIAPDDYLQLGSYGVKKRYHIDFDMDKAEMIIARVIDEIVHQQNMKSVASLSSC